MRARVCNRVPLTACSPVQWRLRAKSIAHTTTRAATLRFKGRPGSGSCSALASAPGFSSNVSLSSRRPQVLLLWSLTPFNVIYCDIAVFFVCL